MKCGNNVFGNVQVSLIEIAIFVICHLSLGALLYTDNVQNVKLLADLFCLTVSSI